MGTVVIDPACGRRGWNLVGEALSESAMRRAVAGACVVLSLAGCAHGATRARRAHAEFSTTSPVGVDDREADRLAALARGDGVARAVRLERLLDLFDAARLAGDNGARDVLWQALGGHGTGRGPDATREALTRLLAEASALEDLAISDEDARLFVNDAIALVTTDLQTPAEADQLAVRTLAYRTLASDGHPRIRDNARWRLYDHVRGTLAAALLRPPEGRTDIAIQAQYATVEDLGTALSDAGVHERARWPGATGLVALLEAQREALAKDPAWATVVEPRAANDRELADAILAGLPASRTNGLVAPKRPRGTGLVESLAPLVHVSSGRIDIDAGRPQSRALPLVDDDDDVAAVGDAIRDALAQDGRGALLLLVDPSLPAPELRRALRGIRRGNAARVELALLEPHADGGTVATALPITVMRDASAGASSQTLVAARVHVHIGGRGLELALDGKWLPGVLGTHDEVDRRLATVVTAYPRERAVRITIGADVSHEQIVEATAALVGGPSRRFALVGWMPDESRPAGAAEPSLERLLADRASWAAMRSVAIEQPFPLAGDDQRRLRAFADALPRCLPELGSRPAKPKPERVEVRITIADGRVQPITAPKIAGVGPKAITAMTSCLQDEGYALRLREHRDTIAIVLRAT